MLCVFGVFVAIRNTRNSLTQKDTRQSRLGASLRSRLRVSLRSLATPWLAGPWGFASSLATPSQAPLSVGLRCVADAPSLRSTTIYVTLRQLHLQLFIKKIRLTSVVRFHTMKAIHCRPQNQHSIPNPTHAYEKSHTSYLHCHRGSSLRPHRRGRRCRLPRQFGQALVLGSG